MSPNPLVSVMMPCFNAATTLPMALASLKAQTYSNWEALIVDDGSTDATWQILNDVRDPRFKLERFTENRGRGAARQRCLEMLRGEYLAPLDSDDWMYPQRIEKQVAWLQSDAQLSMISNAYVVTDEDGNAIGYAAPGLKSGEQQAIAKMQRVSAPPLAFPSSMIRMRDAKGARFNPRFRRSQDSDFILQFLRGRNYGVSGEVLYSYTFNFSDALKNTFDGYRYRMQCYAQYFNEEPFNVAAQIARTFGKMLTYRSAEILGTQRALIEKRWNPLSDSLRARHSAAKRAIETHM